METLLYIGKSALVLSLFFSIYEFFLKRETFFRANRVFLLSGIFSAALLPALKFYKTIIVSNSDPVLYFQERPLMPVENSVPETAGSFWETINYTQVALWIYVLVSIFFIARFLIKILQLYSKFRKSENSTFKNGVYYIQTTDKINPFSFLNTIVYNPKLHRNKELNMIVEHEEAHVRHFHSLDILLVNLAVFLNWFNPLAWLYRKRVIENLEFMADRDVINQRNSTKSYQLSLLKATLPNNTAFPVNNFHQSFLKSRILMLDKTKSSKGTFLKFGLIIPLLAIFFFSFQIEAQEKTEATSSTSIIPKDYFKNHAKLVLNDHKKLVNTLADKAYALESIKMEEDVDILKLEGKEVSQEKIANMQPQEMKGLYLIFRKGGKVMFIDADAEDKTGVQSINVYRTDVSSEEGNSETEEKIEDVPGFPDHHIELSAKKEEIEAIIFHSATKEELETLKGFLQDEYEMEFDYSNLKFNADDKITSLKIDVDSKNAGKGSIYIDTKKKGA